MPKKTLEGNIRIDGTTVCWQYDNEVMTIEPWGESSFRVRSSRYTGHAYPNWALTEECTHSADIKELDGKVIITNGKIVAILTKSGQLTFENSNGDILLKEYWRTRQDLNEFCSALNLFAREMKPHLGGDYSLTTRFESDADEKLFGMGQYQQPHFNLKGCTLELAHRNSQASVPFMLSSKGYGFLWNNPAIGYATFGKNITEWRAASTKAMDYWITAGDTPSEIMESYSNVTGKTPMMPEFGLGLWQSKLRYATQNELLTVAREYHRRKLPLDVIVIDFFHWPIQGSWKLDPRFWPDPKAMVDELSQMGINLMISIWPTVDLYSPNYDEMLKNGYLVQCERGMRITIEGMGACGFYDATHPDAQKFLWSEAKKNYYDYGIKLFWLDEAEPEYGVYDFDNYRYHIGSNMQVGNIYPTLYTKGFYDGLKQEGQDDIVTLVRCAWAGSQKYAALVWSGDIDSSFESMRNQLSIGLSMGIAGIPWWTTDIGGFHGGNPDDENFRECIIRWFQWGAFCPVFRLHGDRSPSGMPEELKDFEGVLGSGANNEVWSYGDTAYEIFKKYIFLREKIRPIVREAMEQAHTKGSPVMRPLFYNYPADKKAWEVYTEYCLGDDLLVAPILYEGQRNRDVYLPAGNNWICINSNNVYQGGETHTVDAPLDTIPVFARADSKHVGLFQE